MISAKQWLRATNRCLKQDAYGNRKKCGLCRMVFRECTACIIFLLEDDVDADIYLPCTDWLDIDMSVEDCRRYLLELKYALEDYIKRQRRKK